MTRWIRAAVIAYPVVIVLDNLLIWAQASAWRQYFHAFGAIFDNLGSPDALSLTWPSVPVGIYAGWLLLIPEIIFLIWQYRVARGARMLGYPARHSPGWGVGAWFVPVVSLFIPVQAITDCLPPGHRCRSLTWKLWILALVGSLLDSSLTFTIPEIPGVGLPSLVITVLIAAVLVVGGLRLIEAIAADHREAITGRL